MRLVQLSGPHLVVTELSDIRARIAETPDPWDIEGIAGLVAAMTGTAASPVIVSPPALTPAVAFVGDDVAVFPGIFTGATATAILRLNGVNVTSQIIDGQFTPEIPGSLSLTVSAPPLASISVSATISPLPIQPVVPAQFGPDDWTLTTGALPGQLLLSILDLPTDGGSPINAIMYRVNDGTPQTFGGTGAGTRTIDGGDPDTLASVTIQAVNAIGPAEESAAKEAQTAAGVATEPPVTFTRDETGITMSEGGTFPDVVWTRTANQISFQEVA